MTFYAYIVRRMRLCKLCHPLRNPIINLNGNQRVIVTSISPTGRLDGTYSFYHNSNRKVVPYRLILAGFCI